MTKPNAQSALEAELAAALANLPDKQRAAVIGMFLGITRRLAPKPPVKSRPARPRPAPKDPHAPAVWLSFRELPTGQPPKEQP